VPRLYNEEQQRLRDSRETVQWGRAGKWYEMTGSNVPRVELRIETAVSPLGSQL
jgi:hypothetical protein